MQQERSRMLGSMPMGRLIPTISVPIMISMLVQALYNIVDSIFVARYSQDALTATALVYPIQMLMVALATGMGTGINSLVSRKLGEKLPEEAREAAKNGVLIAMVSWLLFVVVGLGLSRPLLAMFTPDAALQELGSTYLTIVCTFSTGLFGAICFERLMQATGNTVFSMITQLTGAVINIVLDPILIFGLFGLPSMGIAGAGWATVIGQLSSMTLGIFLNQTRNKELRLSLRGFRPSLTMLRGIVAVGLPSTVMSSIGSVLNVCMNMILIGFGNAAVSVLGVYFRLQSFVFMPVFGLSNGLVAIVGYNYGAKLRARVYAAIRVAMGWAGTIMILGMTAFLLMPEALMSLFESGEAGELTAIGVVALRTICLSFIPAAIGVILSTVFQAVGRGTYSLIMSLCRQLVVLLPVAWLLSRIGGLNALWWAFPIAEVASLVICLGLFAKCNREMIRPLEEG